VIKVYKQAGRVTWKTKEIFVDDNLEIMLVEDQ